MEPTSPAAAVDFSEIDGLLGDRARLIEHPQLGRTLEALRHIAPGELILSELPLLIASSARALPSAMRRKYQAAAGSGDFNLDDLLIMHAFARASDPVRRRVLHGFCAEECCPPDHPLVVSAQQTATFCQLHDPAAAALPAAELLSAAMVFSLNAFGYLADGTTGGATTVFWAASKFTHRCLRPNAVFHGDAGRLTFRAVRAVAPGEVLTISYLGPWAHCLAPLRRKTLWKTKGFGCLCADCLGEDVMRPLPCPACVPRSATSGLLLLAPDLTLTLTLTMTLTLTLTLTMTLTLTLTLTLNLNLTLTL